jgi:hypothetical protein
MSSYSIDVIALATAMPPDVAPATAPVSPNQQRRTASVRPDMELSCRLLPLKVTHFNAGLFSMLSE